MNEVSGVGLLRAQQPSQVCESGAMTAERYLAVEQAAQHAEETKSKLYQFASDLERIQSKHTGTLQSEGKTCARPARDGAVGFIQDTLDTMDDLISSMREVLGRF